MNKGRMARLDPNLGQSLKEIVPNADAIFIFVCVSHDTLEYDAWFNPRLIYISSGRENTGRRVRVQGGLDVAKAGLVWPRMAWFYALEYHRPQYDVTALL